MGERGKFCGMSGIFSKTRRRCTKDEWCATAAGGLVLGEFACIKITVADRFQNQYCREDECSCGLRMKIFGRCSKGEICHNNNSLGFIGNALAMIPLGIGEKFYPQFCSLPSKYEKVYKFNQKDFVDEKDEFFQIELEALKTKKTMTYEEYQNHKATGNFEGKLTALKRSDQDIEVKTRYAYLGEEGKFCGKYINIGLG